MSSTESRIREIFRRNDNYIFDEDEVVVEKLITFIEANADKRMNEVVLCLACYCHSSVETSVGLLNIINQENFDEMIDKLRNSDQC